MNKIRGKMGNKNKNQWEFFFRKKEKSRRKKVQKYNREKQRKRE